MLTQPEYIPTVQDFVEDEALTCGCCPRCEQMTSCTTWDVDDQNTGICYYLVLRFRCCCGHYWTHSLELRWSWMIGTDDVIKLNPSHIMDREYYRLLAQGYRAGTWGDVVRLERRASEGGAS